MFHSSEPVEPAAIGASDMEHRGSQWSRPRVTFWLLTIGCAVVGAVVVSPWRSPLLGGAVGALLGAVLGGVAGLVMAAWPVLRAVWRWLFELTIVAATVAGVTWFAAVTGSWWWSTLLLALAGAGGAVGPVRRRVLAVVWCAIVRHRLRMCFAAFIRARNHLDPSLAPLILLARPTPAGERVWVWLRTGQDIGELERRSGKIAVTCWASEVQVCASRRFAALVRIDITRRDPLRLVVASPLVDPLPEQRPRLVCVPDDASGLALDLDDVPEASVVVEKAGRR